MRFNGDRRFRVLRGHGRRAWITASVMVAAAALAACGSSSSSSSSSSAAASAGSATAASTSSSSSSAAAGGDHFTYAISISEPDPFTTAVVAGMRQEAAALGDKVIAVADANSSASKQYSDVQDLIAQHPDAILLDPVDSVAAESIVTNAVSEHVPVLDWLSAIGTHYGMPLYQGLTASFQFDEYGSGETAGEIMGAHVPPGSTIGVVLGQAGYSEVPVRLAGFEAGLAKHGKYNVVVSPDGQWTPAWGLSECQELKAAHPNMAGIYLESDNQTVGCVEAENIGTTQLVSTGGEKQVLALISAGKVLGAACYLPTPFGAGAIKAIHAILSGQAKAGQLSTLVPVGVTKANLSACPSGD